MLLFIYANWYNDGPTGALFRDIKDLISCELCRSAKRLLCFGLQCPSVTHTEAKFLDKIQTKVLRVFLLAIHSHIYSLALRFLFLQTHATSYIFYSSVTVHCKGKRGKPDRKTNPLSFGLRNLYRNLKSENSQDYAQKPKRNCTFMNSASGGNQIGVGEGYISLVFNTGVQLTTSCFVWFYILYMLVIDHRQIREFT
jgi:hypothetical protein